MQSETSEELYMANLKKLQGICSTLVIEESPSEIPGDWKESVTNELDVLLDEDPDLSSMEEEVFIYKGRLVSSEGEELNIDEFEEGEDAWVVV